MKTVTSNDGTAIAFDQSGKGPALILVGGMFEQRRMDSETSRLAALPLLGYGGYLPFALELYALYHFVEGLLEKKDGEYVQLC